jgi:hypothetical protein
MTTNLRCLRLLAALGAISITTCAPSQTSGTPSRISELLAQLASPNATGSARSELIAKCKDDPTLLAEVAKALPSMLTRAPNDAVMESEAKLAGALKITSTIPELARLLGHPIWDPGGGLTYNHELRGDPVARALYEMGPAAYPALAQALQSSDRGRRARAMGVLVLADNKECRQILRAHLNAERDPLLRHFIAANIDEPTGT